MKIFQRFLLGSFLFAWGAVPAFAQVGQFSILPFTDKTPEECKEVLADFDLTGKIPTGSFIQKVAENEKNAEAAFLAGGDYNNLKAESDKANADYKKAKEDFEKANPGQSCGVSYGGSCYDSFDAAQKAQEKTDDAKKAKDEADAAFNQSNTSDVQDLGVAASEMLDVKDHLLGCAIKTGRISLAMIPYFFTYFINFLLGLSGIVVVLFIVIGGYHYVVGGLTEEKEKGKNTIKNALLGMAVALLAWTIVTVLINAITG